MIAIINTLVNSSMVEVSLSWSPATTYTYTAPNGTVVTAPKAAVNTALSFTAGTQVDNDLTGSLTLIEYRWNFGDGTIGYGAGTTHTYIVPNLQAHVVLRVTDSKGRHWYGRQQLYLS